MVPLPTVSAQNLGWWPYLGNGVFEDVIKWRLLPCDHPELPRWALNPITSVLTRERQRDLKHTEQKVMWRWDRDPAKQPHAEERLELEEAGEDSSWAVRGRTALPPPSFQTRLPEPQEDTVLWLWTTRFVVLGYGSHRKWIRELFKSPGWIPLFYRWEK